MNLQREVWVLSRVRRRQDEIPIRNFGILQGRTYLMHRDPGQLWHS